MTAKLSQEQISLNRINHIQINKISLDLDVVEDYDENNYYLNHTIDGKESMCGSLFYYSSYPNIIYGHNMANGSMFGKLNNLVIGDKVKITIDNTYNYTVGDIYYTDSSYFPSSKLYNKNNIYLSTCSGKGRMIISLKKRIIY